MRNFSLVMTMKWSLDVAVPLYLRLSRSMHPPMHTFDNAKVYLIACRMSISRPGRGYPSCLVPLGVRKKCICQN